MVVFFSSSIIIMYVGLATLAQFRIAQSIVLSKKQKSINSLLNWLVPFVWSVNCLVNYRKTDTLEVITKADRKISTENNSDGMPVGGDSASGDW